MKRNIKFFIVLACLTSYYGNIFTHVKYGVTDISTTVNKQIKPQEFSLKLKIKSPTTLKNHWSFGFYMPCTFNHLEIYNAHINPKLSLSICKCSKNPYCIKLHYNKHLSAGYLNVLTPAKQFTLKQNEEYTIKLMHSNQSVPTNLSAMPQSFFIMTK